MVVEIAPPPSKGYLHHFWSDLSLIYVLGGDSEDCGDILRMMVIAMK